MTYDMNDAAPQKTGDLIPDGSFAKVTMTIRKGNADGESDHDKGLLKLSNAPGSDVKLLDCEFTVMEGPQARRKFWQNFTVSGGKPDEHGVSIGWKISKSTFRAMIDSALGLDPDDMSEGARQKRILRGLYDLSGLAFVAKIRIEASSNPGYGDSNKLDRVVLPNETEWRMVMAGEAVAPAPSTQRRKTASSGAVAPAPAKSATKPPVPAWAQLQANGAASPSPVTTKPASGPAWLNT